MDNHPSITPDDVLPPGGEPLVSFAVLIRDENGVKMVGLSMQVTAGSSTSTMVGFKTIDKMDKLADAIKGACQQARTGLQVVRTMPGHPNGNFDPRR